MSPFSGPTGPAGRMSELHQNSRLEYVMSVMPFKPGMRIKSGESVFVFVDGVTVETFEKDEDFRSGTVTTVVAGKARIEWDETVRVVRGGQPVLTNKYEYVALSRLTRVERETWVLDYKSPESVSSEMPVSPGASDAPGGVTEMSDSPVESDKPETPVVPVQSRKSRTSGKPANA